MIPDEWLAQATARIAPHLVRTPLTRDKERDIFLKWENHQVTGSFKARGALNKVLSLADWERTPGLVAASAGNHGQGVALAGKLTGASVEVFVPRHTGNSKIESMRGMGAIVRTVDGGYADAEHAARTYAQAQGRTFVSPYNDPQVVAGQGTLASECLAQLSKMQSSGKRQGISAWVLPVGGGGLISGCGAVLSGLEPRPKLIGVQAEASAFAHSLFHNQTQDSVEDRPTLAEGLSGAVEADSLTIPMLRRYVDDILLVSEVDIKRAIAFAWRTYGERIEGSAAVGLAAILGNKVQLRPALVIITGGNIEDELHVNILDEYADQVRN